MDQNFTFVFVAVDNIMHEPLLGALPDSAFSIRVGMNPSFAKFNVRDVSLLLKLLEELPY